MATRQNSRSLISADLLENALISDRAFSFTAYLILFPLGVFVTSNSYQLIAKDLGLNQLLLFGILGMLAAGFVLGLSTFFVQQFSLENHKRIKFTLVAYATAGIARSSFVYYLVVGSSEISSHFLDLVRLSMLGAMHGLVWFSIFAILLNLADQFRGIQTEFESWQKHYLAFKSNANENLQQDVALVQEMIRKRLQPVLRRVTKQIQVADLPDTNILHAAEALRETCENEVRKLSHRLAEPLFVDGTVDPAAEQVSWNRLISPRFFRAELHVFPVFAITFYMAAFLVIAQRRPELLLHNTIALMAGAATLFVLVKVFWNKIIWQYRIYQVVLIYTVTTFSIFAVVMMDFGYHKYPELQMQILIDVPLSFFLAWILFSFFDGFQAYGKESQSALSRLQIAFETEQKQLFLQRSQLRKLLSTLLHGNVQGGLAAVSLALVTSQSAAKSEKSKLLQQAESQLRKVQSELNQILNFDLQISELFAEDSDLTLNEIQTEIDQWAGLLSVEFDIDESKIDFVNAAGLGAAILVALKESLQNAVRHGHARKVWIQLFVTSADISIVISNDGQFDPTQTPIEGQGSREIGATGGVRTIVRNQEVTDVTIKWSLP